MKLEKKQSKTHPIPLFIQRFNGRFSGILHWEQLDELWLFLKQECQEKARKEWFVYHVGSVPPTEPLSEEKFILTLDEINKELKQHHKEDYCGIVYADNIAAPDFIKVFHPNNLGKSCGYSETPIFPGWTISKIPPIDIENYYYPPKQPSFWKKLYTVKA